MVFDPREGLPLDVGWDEWRGGHNTRSDHYSLKTWTRPLSARIVCLHSLQALQAFRTAIGTVP